MRSYKAARRASARRDNGRLPAIPFELTYWAEPGERLLGEPADDGTPQMRVLTEPEEVTETFNCYGELSAVTLTDAAWLGEQGVTNVSAEGVAMVRRIFEEAIGDPAEFKRFWAVARKIDEDDLFEVMQGVMEDVTGRPTGRPSDSSTSSSRTGTGSTASGSAGTAAVRPFNPTSMLSAQPAQVVYLATAQEADDLEGLASSG